MIMDAIALFQASENSLPTMHLTEKTVDRLEEFLNNNNAQDYTIRDRLWDIVTAMDIAHNIANDK